MRRLFALAPDRAGCCAEGSEAELPVVEVVVGDIVLVRPGEKDPGGRRGARRPHGGDESMLTASRSPSPQDLR